MFPGGKHNNSKTGLSFDVTTICPLTRAGKPCAYCYVNTHRKLKDSFSKIPSRYDRYDGFVLRMRQDSIDQMNEVGGIRMFSFGDYFPEHRPDIERFLTDCDIRRLKAKAITKQLRFVHVFHDNPAISTMHISIDNLKGNVGRSPINHVMAKKTRLLYSKVKVRAVVLNEEDLQYFGKQSWVDILTLNHGMNGFHSFTHDEVKKAAARYPGRVCCAGKTCSGCRIKCGLQKNACAA